ELKTALENDRLAFGAYISAYKARLKASGASDDEIFEALTDALTDRVCELCYTQGHAPEARTDIAGEDTPVINRRNTAACTVALDDSEAKYVLKSVNVCDRQMPLLMATGRLFTAANSDEALIAAWDKAAAYWQGDLDGEYKTLIDKADPLERHHLLTEKAALLAVIKNRRALYDAYYADELISAQLTARLIQQSAMSLCK
ncbi:MAG: hypothetical protein II920_02645, partial [Clostridia bacterium]|nr:hypothetical protein [Clostridia bacterium]